MPISGWIVKQNVVCLHTGNDYDSAIERHEASIHTTSNMGSLWVKRPATKGPTAYDFICMNSPQQAELQAQKGGSELPRAVGDGECKVSLHGCVLGGTMTMSWT